MTGLVVTGWGKISVFVVGIIVGISLVLLGVSFIQQGVEADQQINSSYNGCVATAPPYVPCSHVFEGEFGVQLLEQVGWMLVIAGAVLALFLTVNLRRRITESHQSRHANG